MTVSGLRIIYLPLVFAGLVLAFAPTLMHDPGPAADTFAAVERRIPWGGVMGLGALLAVRTQLKPWAVTLGLLVFWVTVGILVARCIGIALDGSDERQWMWVGVEFAVTIIAAIYLKRKGWRFDDDSSGED